MPQIHSSKALTLTAAARALKTDVRGVRAMIAAGLLTGGRDEYGREVVSRSAVEAVAATLPR